MSAVAVGASQALVDASHSATMVAVGSRGRDALTETVLGSDSNNVLHHARCPWPLSVAGLLWSRGTAAKDVLAGWTIAGSPCRSPDTARVAWVLLL